MAGCVFARAVRQLGGGIIGGNSLILLLAWRADSLTADLLVSPVITSVIMATVGVLARASTRAPGPAYSTEPGAAARLT